MKVRPCVAGVIRGGLPILGLLLAFSSSAAERSDVLSLRRFELLDRLSATDQSSEADSYLRGISDGLTFANASLESSGKTRLFCASAPPGVRELRILLREQIEFLGRIGQQAEQAMERTAAVAIVLQKLREKYPCRAPPSSRRPG